MGQKPKYLAVLLAVTDKQLVLYSVGPDLKDDSGKELDDRGVTGDVTFTLPR